MNDESKEIKVSEEMKRGGQCELDDDAIEQAAGGIEPENPRDPKKTGSWADAAWERVKKEYT